MSAATKIKAMFGRKVAKPKGAKNMRDIVRNVVETMKRKEPKSFDDVWEGRLFDAPGRYATASDGTLFLWSEFSHKPRVSQLNPDKCMGEDFQQKTREFVNRFPPRNQTLADEMQKDEQKLNEEHREWHRHQESADNMLKRECPRNSVILTGDPDIPAIWSGPYLGGCHGQHQVLEIAAVFDLREPGHES